MNAIAKIPAPARRAMLAKIHIAKKAIGLTDESYRDLVRVVTGKESARDLDDAEAGRLMERFYQLGFKESGPKVKVAGSPLVGKAKALWSSLYWLGAVGLLDDASGPDWRALDRFARRTTKKDALAFCTPAETVKVIEGLRAMCAREGFALDEKADGVAARCALVRAMWGKLAMYGNRPAGPTSRIGYIAARARIFRFQHDPEQASAAQLDQLIRHIGKMLRHQLHRESIEPLSTGGEA